MTFLRRRRGSGPLAIAAHLHEAAAGAGHGAAYEQQVLGRVDAHDRQAALSDVASLEVALGDELLPSVGSHRWRSARLPTTTHSMVGFVWPREEVEPRLLVSSRRSGTWAPWRLVPLMHDLPDEDDEEWHGRAGTQLVWIGPADGIRIKAEGRRPDGLILVLMHPRSRDDDALVRSPLARADTGMTVVARPPMSGREVWGADEWWRDGGPATTAPSSRCTCTTPPTATTTPRGTYRP